MSSGRVCERAGLAILHVAKTKPTVDEFCSMDDYGLADFLDFRKQGLVAVDDENRVHLTAKGRERLEGEA